MKTRAKFICQSLNISKYAGGESHSVILTPVTPYNSEGQENKSFWDATPTGEIKLTITNKEAVKLFEPGKKYYIDFTPAPDTL